MERGSLELSAADSGTAAEAPEKLGADSAEASGTRTAAGFPEHLIMQRPERQQLLVQDFYETHHREHRDIQIAKDSARKLRFYLSKLEEHGGEKTIRHGVDLGCRGGSLTKELTPKGAWVGVDLDRNAVALANRQGVPCIEMNIMTALDFQDEAFDAVCLTEVLEHLPYPTITLKEVWRILKKSPDSVFMGSVPIDYYYRARLRVILGKTLSTDPTHLRSFSAEMLKDLLDRFFEHVELHVIGGKAMRHPWLPLNLFAKNIAWFARAPRKAPR